MDLSVLRGLLGIGVLLAIAVFFSKHRKSINVRTVSLAFALQMGLGAFVLYIPFGKDVFSESGNLA